MANSPKDSLQPLIKKLLSLTKLEQEDQKAVLALPHEVRVLESHSFVVREGDKPTHCCLLAEGFAIRHKIVGANGARQIVNCQVPGDMVDLQNSLLGIADHNVQALTRSTGIFIPREAILELSFARPAVGKALWTESLVEAAILREWIANIGRRDARSRVAHLLCEFAYRLDAVELGAECNYELPMTQEQIADSVGLTSVHVNRTLKALDKDGLTKRTKKSVVIKDIGKLAAAGDFRPLYLHLASEAA